MLRPAKTKTSLPVPAYYKDELDIGGSTNLAKARRLTMECSSADRINGWRGPPVFFEGVADPMQQLADVSAFPCGVVASRLRR